MTAMTKFIKWDWLVSSDLKNTARWRYEFYSYLANLEIDNKVDLCGLGRVDLVLLDDPTDKRLLALKTATELDVNKRFRRTLYAKDQSAVDEIIEFVHRTAKQYGITVLDIEVKDSLDVELLI
jgi:hypothetical protein